MAYLVNISLKCYLIQRSNRKSWKKTDSAFEDRKMLPGKRGQCPPAYRLRKRGPAHPKGLSPADLAKPGKPLLLRCHIP